MDNVRVKYVSTAHSSVGSEVAFTLQRQDGGQFRVFLSPSDAELLLEDLGTQVHIATQGSK